MNELYWNERRRCITHSSGRSTGGANRKRTALTSLATHSFATTAKLTNRLKTVGPILALTNYQPQTYNALLSERKDELYAIGGDNGLSKDAMSKVARITPEGQAPSAPVTEQKQKATDEEVKAYANQHYKGDIAKAQADLKSKGFL